MTVISRTRLASPLLALLAGWSLCFAAPPPLEEAKDQLKKLRTHLSAVSNRFKGGMKVARPSEDPDQPTTPALECCEANLRVVRDRLVGFERAVLKLAACYQQTGNFAAIDKLGPIRTEAGNLRIGLDYFVKAPTRSEAGMAMAGTTRAFLLLDKDVQALEACESDADYPTSDPSGP